MTPYHRLWGGLLHLRCMDLPKFDVSLLCDAGIHISQHNPEITERVVNQLGRQIFSTENCDIRRRLEITPHSLEPAASKQLVDIAHLR